MRVLTFTSLYPNEQQPRHGIFVESRMRKLRDSFGDIDLRVVAPVPWFPFKNPSFGLYSRYAAVGAIEQRFDIPIYHPRYLAMPKVGMYFTPFTMALAALPLLRKLQDEWEFDLIDAHYFYPDGVAATLLAKWLGVPLIITARGSDINVLNSYTLPRTLNRWAAKRAFACIGVSAHLTQQLSEMLGKEQTAHLLRNGVDLKLFRPGSPDQARQLLGLPQNTPIVITVGNLVPLKGQELLLKAVAQLPDWQLVIVGEGPLRTELKLTAGKLGMSERVMFVGNQPQAKLVEYYRAADVLALVSHVEGMPNVVLECLACGTPVVGTSVGGIPEVVRPPAGELVADRDPEELANKLVKLYQSNVDAETIRQYAEKFDWQVTLTNLYALMQRSHQVVTVGEREDA